MNFLYIGKYFYYQCLDYISIFSNLKMIQILILINKREINI